MVLPHDTHEFNDIHLGQLVGERNLCQRHVFVVKFMAARIALPPVERPTKQLTSAGPENDDSLALTIVEQGDRRVFLPGGIIRKDV